MKEKVSWLRRIFLWISDKWEDIRFFAYFNKTLIEVVFMLTYTLEQAALIFIVSQEWLNSVTVSYFVLVVLTTFSLHKIVMESRIRLLDEEIKELKKEKDTIKMQSKRISESYNRLLDAYKRAYK